MIKWVILSVIAIVVTIFVICIIKVMLKTEKESKQATNEVAKPEEKEYTPADVSINVGSSANSIVTDMSNDAKNLDNVKAEYDVDMSNSGGFLDEIDTEFDDYREHVRKGGGKRRVPDDFDLEGDRADEYIPDSPEFNYIPPRRSSRKNKSIKTELNELPTELKVLMLSDIFDRKFFD